LGIEISTIGEEIRVEEELVSSLGQSKRNTDLITRMIQRQSDQSHKSS